MANINYKVGMLVDHPNRPQWGPGKIVHVGATKVQVFFRDAMERKARPIVLAIVSLTVAASQSDSVLDALPAASEEDGGWVLPASYGKRPAEPAAPKKKKSSRAAAAAAPAAPEDAPAAAV